MTYLHRHRHVHIYTLTGVYRDLHKGTHKETQKEAGHFYLQIVPSLRAAFAYWCTHGHQRWLQRLAHTFTHTNSDTDLEKRTYMSNTQTLSLSLSLSENECVYKCAFYVFLFYFFTDISYIHTTYFVHDIFCQV